MGFTRVILIIMDSVGIGELPDAFEYGDEGSYTLQNTAEAVGGLRLPNLGEYGLGNVAVMSGRGILGVEAVGMPKGAFGRMAEVSKGKDTTTGHWEICGLISQSPFPIYPNGFPVDLIDEIERVIGRKSIGNKAASGTEIIEELGGEHMRSGAPIIYTSADSVLQIAAHEGVIPLEELYDICMKVRELMRGDHAVARVIARPFAGSPGSFVRTLNRRDFSLDPPGGMLLDLLWEEDLRVCAVGKIEDIFNGRGITDSVHTKSNAESIDATMDFIGMDFRGLIFTNCVDFDMKWGHRNDPEGYARSLEEFDGGFRRIRDALKEDDLLILTADHGCDPTTSSTDHSREYVPLIVCGSRVVEGTELSTRESFADVGATILDALSERRGIRLVAGRSFLDLIEA